MKMGTLIFRVLYGSLFGRQAGQGPLVASGRLRPRAKRQLSIASDASLCIVEFETLEHAPVRRVKFIGHDNVHVLVIVVIR